MLQNFPKKALKVLTFAVLFWVISGYLLPLWLPFFLGFCLAWAAEPMIQLLSSKVRLPRSFSTAISVSSVWILISAVLSLLLAVLVRQGQNLASILPAIQTALTDGIRSLQAWLTSLTARLPGQAQAIAATLVGNLFSEDLPLLQKAIEWLPQVVGNLVGSLSKGLFTAVTAILSGYMISSRLPKIKQWCRSKLPQTWYAQYLPAFRGLRRAAGGWLVAQGKLMGLTFLLLIAGFFLLHIQNVMVVAILITLVDAFPILGTGTILVPWSLICLLQGDHGRGIGLLGLYVVVWLARSVLEPRILGKELGLDPLITLFSVYAGFCIMGIGGMLIAPIVAMLVTQLLKHQTQ